MSDERQRMEVRDCTDVPYMNYVVWDTLFNRPVAYDKEWTQAQLRRARAELHPPFYGFHELSKGDV